MKEEETISDGLKRLGYTHRRDEHSASDGKHLVEGNGHLPRRMSAGEAAELIRALDEADALITAELAAAKASA